MNCHPSLHPERRGRPLDGMTLVEMIGVLAVVALLAVFTFAFTLRHLDQIASAKELQILSSLAGALEANILRTRQIPLPSDWAGRVASESGMDLRSVTNNLRNCRRIFLVDGSGWFSTNLPYTQTVQTGTNIAAVPANARMLLLSTIAGNVPLNSGMLDATEFEPLWNGTIPTTGAWAGWTGRAEDVVIHRINLAPLFVRLVLSTFNSQTNGHYAIGNSTNLAPYGDGVSGYYLRGTAVQLLSATNPPTLGLEHTHLLSQDCSFVFENGVWKGSITGGRTMSAGGGLGIVAAFLAARPNTNAEHFSAAFSNEQQVLIVDAFIQYMSNYNRWWTNGLLRTDPLQDYLEGTLQPYLMDRVQGLYTRISGGATNVDHFPTNDVIWPPP